MKDGYFAQDNGSSTQIEKLLEILIEQNEKQSEQIEKQSELNEKLYDQIEKLNNQIEQKDEIIRKLQKMLFGRKSEKAAALEMMANMEPWSYVKKSDKINRVFQVLRRADFQFRKFSSASSLDTGALFP